MLHLLSHFLPNLKGEFKNIEACEMWEVPFMKNLLLQNRHWCTFVSTFFLQNSRVDEKAHL